MRKRRTRRKAIGTRAPILVEAKPNARWSLDFIYDQLENGRRFTEANLSVSPSRCSASASNRTPPSDVIRLPSRGGVTFYLFTSGNRNGSRGSSFMVDLALSALTRIMYWWQNITSYQSLALYSPVPL